MDQIKIVFPDREWITLTEALTAIAFGQVYDREYFLRMPDEFDHMLKVRMRQCWEEAQKDERYSGFLPRYPHVSVSSLKGALEECRWSWPPAASELHELATAHEREWQSCFD